MPCPPRWRASWKSVLTHTHTYSGRADHGGTVQPPESYRRLARWTAARGIEALGMGSPYTPGSASTYQRYDGKERDTYYAPHFDRKRVRQLDEINGMLEDVARHATHGTLFYLDNETPKGRYGHMWWVGYHPDYPAWHDYDQDFDRWMVHQSIPSDDSDEPMGYHRRPYAQIVAIQRHHGALGFWAHPTSWWRDGEGRFITNIASEMPAHLIAEGFVDGMVVMGYQPYRPAYLALWHKLLDAGYRVPAVAEMDVGLSSEATWRRERVLLNYGWLGERGERSPLTVDDLTTAFRDGRLFASSGPLLDLQVDGQVMGQAVETAAGQNHAVELTAYPADPAQRLGRIELRGRGGELLWSCDDFAGGTLRLALNGTAERSYITARVFGAGEADGEADFRQVAQVAISNPVYLHPRGQTFEVGLNTQVHVAVGADSPFAGGTVRFEDAAGGLLEQGTLKQEGATATMPAHGRVTCVAGDGQSRTDYLINANARLQDEQRYLYRGRFLRDFPDCASGDVPPEAWRLDAFRTAMERVTLNV